MQTAVLGQARLQDLVIGEMKQSALVRVLHGDREPERPVVLEQLMGFTAESTQLSWCVLEHDEHVREVLIQLFGAAQDRFLSALDVDLPSHQPEA